MFSIFLCDDNQDTLEQYRNLIAKIADKYELSIKLTTFTSGESLIFHILESPNQADIIYLDIIMGDQNGVEIAKRLRSLGCQSEIIYLTSSEDYVFEAFDTTPVQYLVKRYTTYDRFEQILIKAILLAEAKKDERFVCESNGIIEIIAMKDISYFEIIKRVVKVHYCNEKVFCFYGKMDDLEQKLTGKEFIRVHRSYIVNLNYVTKFQSQSVVLKTEKIIPIGITYMKTVKKEFSNYLRQNKFVKLGD